MKEYIKLLAQRESKEVLGRNYSNLWLLTLVLCATFISIAFSNGSLIYLSEKMNDPFTNWLNIQNAHGSDKFDELRQALAEPEMATHYGFKDSQSDTDFPLTMVGKSYTSIHYLQCRFFERLNTDFVNAILSEENIIEGAAIERPRLQDRTMGVIITLDVLKKLGYSTDSVPAFISYLSHSPEADTLGVRLIENEFAPIPIPLLGVVKKLPMNMDMVGAQFFYQQYRNDNTFPLDLNNLDYHTSLYYFVEDGYENFQQAVLDLVPDSLKAHANVLPVEMPELISWKPGSFYRVYPDEIRTDLSFDVYEDLAEKIEASLPLNSVKRVYAYNFSDYPPSSNCLSVNFAALDSIRAFERFAKDKYNVQIEMSQVNSKENFNAVSIMANILSLAMMVFSIVCIIMFIVNMMQSYFQKVKRNLGTFKAFGISTGELISVYVVILLFIVAAAVLMALAISWIIQLILPLLGLLKDGEFNYLSLWGIKTLGAVCIIILSTMTTVRIVMTRLLHQTPGDLIYDR